MGCWNETCALSHLPIMAGDKVLWLLIAEQGDSFGCYHTDYWAPRHLPIRGEYDDYGSIERWEEGPVLDSFMEQCQKDLFLYAEDPSGKKALAFPGDHQPRITFPRLLELFLQEQFYFDSNYHMRSVAKRVLARAGNLPEPSAATIGRLERDSVLPIDLMKVVPIMIRADLWDTLLSTPRNSLSRLPYTIGDYTGPDVKLIEEIRETNYGYGGRSHLNPKRQVLEFDVLAQIREKRYLVEGGERLFRELVELQIIEEHMMQLRLNWAPTTGAGSQGQEHEEHARFHQICAGLAIKNRIPDEDDNE